MHGRARRSNASSVVTATSTDSLQRSPSQPTKRREAAGDERRERVEIVGVSVLILIVALAGRWPIADGTSVTAGRRGEQQLQRPVQRRLRPRLQRPDAPRRRKHGDPVDEHGRDIAHAVVRPDNLRIWASLARSREGGP